MSRESTCSTWSNSNSDNDSGILAKLRRLKIQESLLLQNVNKIMLKVCDNDEEFTTLCPDYKSLTFNLQNSYREIKNLFDSLKCNTTSPEALKSCDIEDIKTDVLELEAKMKKFKNGLSLELASLKSDEQEIIKCVSHLFSNFIMRNLQERRLPSLQMNVLTENQVKIIKHPKIKAKPFSDIVPSPVKNIITCPFKCQEVQQFQDFLKSYHRYGGWNEYSHNLFIQSWIKHFGNSVNCNEEINISDITKSNRFLSEIIEKLPGINTEDIIQHSEWYLDYLRLKNCQQEALNKWKTQRKIIKKSQLKDKGKMFIENNNLTDLIREKSKQNRERHVNVVVSDEMKRIEETFSVHLLKDKSFTSDASDGDCNMRDVNDKNTPQKVNFKLVKPRGRFHFAKSTEQWTNMCSDRRLAKDNFSTYIPPLDNIKKLCVPKWRLPVKKN